MRKIILSFLAAIYLSGCATTNEPVEPDFDAEVAEIEAGAREEMRLIAERNKRKPMSAIEQKKKSKKSKKVERKPTGVFVIK
jgi:hypothetical protein